MKQGHDLKKKDSPRERAWSAMRRLGCSIEYDEVYGAVEGDETVLYGLDAMASALIDWKGLDLAAAPLDEVLAELHQDDALVETAARLIDLVGRATYAGGLGEEGAEEAESLRQELVEALDELLNQFEEEESEHSDA